MIYDAAIIGAGPAGMMAAVSAAINSERQKKPVPEIVLIEKNRNPGKKLLLTGNGRCNYTANADLKTLVESFGRKGRFFYDVFANFSNDDVIAFFSSRGILPRYEDNKVFPARGDSSTILDCLINEVKKYKIPVNTGCRVTGIKKVSFNESKSLFEINIKEISIKNNYVTVKNTADKNKDILNNISKKIMAEKIIIATGGMSYPFTGSTGDGYRFASAFGHSVIKPAPSLVPLKLKNRDFKKLAGITLKNIKLSVYKYTGKTTDIDHLQNSLKLVRSTTGDILFTHFGLSGPAALETGLSVHILKSSGDDFSAAIDLMPHKKLDEIKNKLASNRSGKRLAGLLEMTLPDIPRRFIMFMINRLGISPDIRSSEMTKEIINSIASFVKNFPCEIEDTCGFEKAVITEGGIPVSEINPKTMESGIAEGLYFAGEIIELAGPEGGYNLQKAFSTGWLAGKNI